MQKTCIIIAGPTATGKTALAIELAKRLSTEIISADSRQCFKELNIGVAKPDDRQLSEVMHHFINSHSIHQDVSAADFEKYALEKIEHIFTNHDTAVMVGGTGLYIKAFSEGLDPIPAIDQAIRDHIISNYKASGISWLQDELYKLDPDYLRSGEIKNPQRLMRALEVVKCTGQPISVFQSGVKKERNFRTIRIGLTLARDLLYTRINLRVDQMIKNGLIDEARSLHEFKNLNALQTVGYKELFEHFENRRSINSAIELIKQNTRHYAKRQQTWFSKDASIKWINVEHYEELLMQVLHLISDKGK